jgi:hypothetical protein
MMPARPTGLSLAACVLLAAATDCRCIEHPLYDARTNRFDSFYLGGGDSQYRPFRDVEYDPGARFVLEVRVRVLDDAPGELQLAAKLDGETAADVEAEVVAVWPDGSSHDDEVLATFEHVDDGLVLARVDRERLLQLRERGVTISLRFADATPARATLELVPDDLLEPHRGGQPTHEGT